MAIRIYNTKQQGLNANKLSKILSFTDNNFSGLISECKNASGEIVDSITINSNNTWQWNSILENTVISFLSGGVLIDYDVPISSNSQIGSEEDRYPKEFANKNCMWGMLVHINDSNTNLLSHLTPQIIQVQCETIELIDQYFEILEPYGNPSLQSYYEKVLVLNPNSENSDSYAKSVDEVVDPSKTYYYKLESSTYRIKNPQITDVPTSTVWKYYGNTLWVKEGDSFFIPFVCKDDKNNISSMVFNRDGKSYESFLCLRTYYQLLKGFNDKFVWRKGGETLGDVGNLNITENTISNKKGGRVVIDKLSLSNLNSGNLSRLLTLSADNQIEVTSNYVMPISYGGTQANNTQTAKTNLGFYYGTSDPNVVTPKKQDGSSVIPIPGDVYFQIIT